MKTANYVSVSNPSNSSWGEVDGRNSDWESINNPSASSWQTINSENKIWDQISRVSPILSAESGIYLSTENNNLIYAENKYLPGESWQAIEPS